MKNGNSSNHWFRPSTAEGGALITCGERVSMPSSMSCARVANGASCPMIFRRGRRSTPIFATGGWTGPGHAFTTACGERCDKPLAVIRNPARRSWIVKVSRRRKKGAVRLRCGEENKGPKTAYFGGYVGVGAGSSRSSGRCPRSGWSQDGPGAVEEKTRAIEKDLGG